MKRIWLKDTIYLLETLTIITPLIENLERCILETHGCPLGIDTADPQKRENQCQLLWLFLVINHTLIYIDPCLSHQSYSHCLCSIGMHEIITCSGGPLVTFQIYLMERVLQIRLKPEIKFKMSMYVCQLCLDLFERYLRRMDFIRRCSVKMYM